MTFKPGDRVEQSTSGPKYTVQAVSDDGIHLWLKYENPEESLGGLPFTGIAKTYTKVKEFFVEGGEYSRRVQWSIWASTQDVVEHVSVGKVERATDGDFAFCNLTIGNLGPGAKPVDRWITLNRQHWLNGGWKKL